jgi:hypothetical protein
MRANHEKRIKLVSSVISRFSSKLVHIIFLTAFLYLSLPLSGAHSQVTLAWDVSTSSEVTGYNIYYGTSSGDYLSSIDAGKVLTYSISGLQSGVTYYFAVTAYDTSGNESDYSNEVSYSVAAACTYNISPTSKSLGSSSSSGVVSVTTLSSCSWTAVSNASWIIITSNSSTIGSGTVNYSVSANSTTTSRSGTMTITGKVFTVTQAGVSPTNIRRR